mmetsp:Transcript_2103/g.3847  ORF Transcript_2103/g.3847 Transcript_2103/m.3847 type:complete len:212 (-) Transcript_2103:466-1101(-)
MALLRKNRINTPSTSPSRGTGGGTAAAGGSRSGSQLSPPSILRTTSNGLQLPSRQQATSNSTSSSSSNKFNPRLILSQIIALQSLHYLILTILFQINSLLFGNSITIDRIFTCQYLNIWTSEGRIDAVTLLISSVIGSFLLAVIVEKSKKCLDFTCTLLFVHVVICCMYEGVGVLSSFDFWIVNLLGMVIMVLLGEYLCARKELMDIPLLM